MFSLVAVYRWWRGPKPAAPETTTQVTQAGQSA